MHYYVDTVLKTNFITGNRTKSWKLFNFDDKERIYYKLPSKSKFKLNITEKTYHFFGEGCYDFGFLSLSSKNYTSKYYRYIEVCDSNPNIVLCHEPYTDMENPPRFFENNCCMLFDLEKGTHSQEYFIIEFDEKKQTGVLVDIESHRVVTIDKDFHVEETDLSVDFKDARDLAKKYENHFMFFKDKDDKYVLYYTYEYSYGSFRKITDMRFDEPCELMRKSVELENGDHCQAVCFSFGDKKYVIDEKGNKLSESDSSERTR